MRCCVRPRDLDVYGEMGGWECDWEPYNRERAGEDGMKKARIDGGGGTCVGGDPTQSGIGYVSVSIKKA